MPKRHFVGVMPYALNDQGEMILLLGKEWPGHRKFSNLWGVFGGSLEKDDNSLKHGAARECYEESMGFLGTEEEIYKRLGQGYHTPTSVVYPMNISLDTTLPALYKRVYQYCRRCSLRHCPSGFFEKSDIDWFHIESILETPDKFLSPFIRFFLTFLA